MNQQQANTLAGNLTRIGCLIWAGGVLLLMFGGCGIVLLGSLLGGN